MTNSTTIDNPATLTPLQQRDDFHAMWTECAQRQGSTSPLIQIPDGDWPRYQKARQTLKKPANRFTAITVSVEKDGNPVHLLRFPYYDVEFVFDNRPSGGVGMTGRPENVALVMAMMDAEMVERVPQ